jgi:hypothetical protein
MSGRLDSLITSIFAVYSLGDHLIPLFAKNEKVNLSAEDRAAV